jgi:hypothetical protein
MPHIESTNLLTFPAGMTSSKKNAKKKNDQAPYELTSFFAW